jgi:hypothetical protein
MNKKAKTRREIDEWHRQFGHLKHEWLTWLDANGTNYQTATEAWTAFKMQRTGHSSAPDPKRWFRKRK